MSERLQGAVPMLATPFDADDAVDETGLRRIVEHVIAAGANGLAVGGLASEAHGLTPGERERVTEAVVDQVHGRVGILVTVTAESTATAVALAAHAAANG